MKTMNKKRLFATVFCVVVLIGVVYACLKYFDKAGEAMEYLRDANGSVLLLLAPFTFVMWWAAGRIWYPYLKQDGLSVGTLASIQYEVNFVDTVLPFYNLTGFGYAAARLKAFNIPGGRAGGMIVLRYVFSIVTKWIEIAVAMVILVAIGKTGDMPTWIVWGECLLIFAMVAGFILLYIAFHNKIRVPKRLLCSNFWHKPAEKAQKWLDNLFSALDIAFEDKGAFYQSFVAGLVYSLMEVIPYWVVATALGHPEILLQIIVASGAAILVGVFTPTPMGIGGFDAVMILFMSGMGVNAALISIITVTTRILVLAISVCAGFPFWVNGMRNYWR